MELTKENNPGLDIYDITGRGADYSAKPVSQEELQAAVTHIKGVLESLRNDEKENKGPWFPVSVDGVKENASDLIERRSIEQTRKQWHKEYNFSYGLEVSPGSIKIGRKMANPERERLREKSPNYQKKSTIKEWSPKSRANMVARFSSLDCTPLFNNELQRTAMITLTYPDTWEKVVPTGHDAKRHLQSLRKRYERKFKVPFYGLWKVEYQARGAVHFHILCAPPNNPAFRTWLAKTWMKVVNHPDPEERDKHLVSGTHISYEEKYGGFDIRSIIVYFSKHASPHGGSKEYQNQPPLLWKDGKSIGRFWGYFGLKPTIWKIPLSFQEAVTVSRTLRRMAARGLPGQSKPMRKKVIYGRIYKGDKTLTTGQLRKRVVKVPVKRFPSILGFIAVSNGARTTRDLTRVLTLERTGRC